MTETRFTDFYHLLGDLFERYNDGRYSEALDLLTPAKSRYPDWEWLIDNWRACLSALTHQPQQALDILRGVLRRGDWLPEAHWMDADYDSLRAYPEFKNLHAQSIALRTIAERNATAELFVYHPRRGANATHPVLIGLHGHSSNASQISDCYRPAVECGWLVAVPQGAELVAPRLHSWGFDDLRGGLNEIPFHVANLLHDYPVNPGCMVISGFSLGAELGLVLMLKGLVKARGLIGVAMGGPVAHGAIDLDALIAETTMRNGRAYWFIGGQDDPSLIEATYRTAEKLQAIGWTVRVEMVEHLGHEFPADFGLRQPDLLAFAVGDL